MAIIKLGATVVGIRGTVGGVTYSQNASGPYAKLWARSSNPRAPKQQTQRTFIASFAQAWRDLSSAQRDDWDTWAAEAAQEKTNPLGETYYASGFNWFCELNAHVLAAGDTLNEDAPTEANPSPAPLNDAEYHYDTPDAFFTFNAGAFDPDFKVACFLAQSRSLASFASPPRQALAIYDYPGAATTEIDITDDVVALFGEIAESRRYFLEVYAQDPDTGQRSSPTVLNRDSET